MKIAFVREQDKGFLGGISFVLQARLLPDEAEAAAIKKYRAGPMTVLVTADNQAVSVQQLLQGWSRKAKDVNELLSAQAELTSAGQALVGMLGQMTQFVGEEETEAAPGVTMRIVRTQGEKFFGGMKFVLKANAVVSELHTALIDKYKLRGRTLTTIGERRISLDEMLRGISFEGTVRELRTVEAAVVKAGGGLGMYIEILDSFGGETRTPLADGVEFVAKRDQHKGLLGGMSFSLEARLDLDPSTRELISKYKVGGVALGRLNNSTVTVNGLLSGVKEKCKDVFVLLENEDELREAAGNIVAMVEVMRSFGGSVEFDLGVVGEHVED